MVSSNVMKNKFPAEMSYIGVICASWKLRRKFFPLKREHLPSKSANYLSIAPFFALNHIFFSANEEALLKFSNQLLVKRNQANCRKVKNNFCNLFKPAKKKNKKTCTDLNILHLSIPQMWRKPVYIVSYNLWLHRLIHWDMLMPLCHRWYSIHKGHNDSLLLLSDT